MTQPITLLGATGSIGRSTLDVVARYPDRFHIHAVAGGSRVAPLVDVCRQAKPKRAVIADSDRLDELRQALKAEGLGILKWAQVLKLSLTLQKMLRLKLLCRPWWAQRALLRLLPQRAQGSDFYLRIKKVSFVVAVL